MPEISHTISHYRILQKTGQGGMGEVYLADDMTLNHKVALKFLPEAFTSDPEIMARFERKAKHLASLNHPQYCRNPQDGTGQRESFPGFRVCGRQNASGKVE